MITWGVYGPLALAAHGIIKFHLPKTIQTVSTLSPGIAVIILTMIDGRAGFKKILLSIIYWRVPIKWYIFSIFISATCVVSSLVIYRFVLIKPIDNTQWYLPVILIFIFLPFSPLWEEIGWRGFFLPKLQEKFSPMTSALILGLIWGVWHIPIYLTINPEGNKTGIFLVYFIAGTISITILTVWIYNNIKGSLLPLIIFHSALNATFSLFTPLPSGELRPFIFTMIFFTIIAGIVCLSTKGKLGFTSSTQNL